MRTLTEIIASLALLAAVLTLGCSSPKPPTITPQRVELVTIQADGLGLRVYCQAHNPNSVALPVRQADAKVVLAGVPVANATARSLATLAPKADTPMTFEVNVPWPSIAAGLALARAGDEVPYQINGTAQLQAAGMQFSVPVNYQGNVKKSDLTAAILQFSPIRLPTLRPGMLPTIK